MSKIKLESFREVDISEQVRQIQVVNNSELEDLTIFIETIQQKSYMLCQEISSLTKTSFNSSGLDSSDVLKRLDIILGFIEHTLGMDVLALQNSAHEKLQSLENNLIELYKVSKDARNMILNQVDVIRYDPINYEGGVDPLKTRSSFDFETINDESLIENHVSSYWDYVPGWGEGCNNSLFQNEDIAATIEPELIAKRSDRLECQTNPVSEAEISHTDKVEEPQSGLSQEVVRQKIIKVRDKYVIGKVAGEDLIDNSGQMIIRKNDIITESVMEMAFDAGKLADLIINMELTGQED